MVSVSIQSPPQLAEELQSKPLNSEIRELLKLLSKPNLKVRMCCTCRALTAWVCAAASSGCMDLVCLNNYMHFQERDTTLIGNTIYERTRLTWPINNAVTNIYKRKSVEDHCLFTTHMAKSRCLLFFL